MLRLCANCLQKDWILREFGKQRRLTQVGYAKSADTIKHPASRDRLGKMSSTLKHVDSAYSVARRLIVLFVLLAVIIGGGVLAFVVFKSIQASSTIFVSNQRSGDGEYAISNQYADSDLPILSWERRKERINILALGLDRRAHERPENTRTDTMMVMSIDPEDMTVSMISIPRDLEILYENPNGGRQRVRINAVHVHGSVSGDKGSGSAAAKKAVSELLGIPVHYFVRVDFSGFERVVDELGGITIDVQHRLYDYQYPDENYGYDPIRIEPGVRVMDGNLALKYARSRYAIDAIQAGDLARSRRQQEVIVAIKEKAIASRWGLISNPVRIAAMLDTLKDNILTDIQLEEMAELAKITQKIDTANPRKVSSMVIGPPEIYHEDRPGSGWRFYMRDPSGKEIQKLVAEFLADPFIRDDILKEEAFVRFENGTSVAGVASDVGLKLRQSHAIKTESPANADSNEYKRTIIYDNSRGTKPQTVGFLERYFNVSRTVQTEIFPGETADIVVIVGQDYLESLPAANTRAP